MLLPAANIIRRASPYFAVLLLLAAHVTCGPAAAVAEGPERVVADFYRDVEAGRTEEALGRVRPEDRRAVKALLKHLAPKIRQRFKGIQRIDTEVVTIGADHARVDAEVLWKNGEQRQTPHALVRQDGQWLLQVDFASDAEEALPAPEEPPAPCVWSTARRSTPSVSSMYRDRIRGRRTCRFEPVFSSWWARRTPRTE
ncbi:MAG: hypothetical protein R6U98_20500 [Pirellulaceae bacterium]